MDCGIASSSGSRNSNWKGGENSLSNYLRNKIILWKKDSMSEHNYKCVITNDRFDDIHHRYSFNLIRDEALFNTGLDIRAEVNQYTEDELSIITNETIKLHKVYGLGVTLRRDVHKLFHSLYGTGDNTPEQFDEFKIRFNIGEFDDILTDNKVNKNCV